MWSLRALADSLEDIHYFIDPIGKKHHRENFKRYYLWDPYLPQWLKYISQFNQLVTNFIERNQKGYIFRYIVYSMANTYYFIDPIGEKIHRNISKRDTLWYSYMPQYLTFISQLTQFVTNSKEKKISRSIASSLTNIYYFISFIGEIIHRRKKQEISPIISVYVSSADIYFSIEPIFDKLYRKEK